MATTNTSPVKTYQDTGSLIRDVANAGLEDILLTATKYPILTRFAGGSGDRPTSFKRLPSKDGMAHNVKYEWGDDDLRPVKFTLNADITNAQTTIVTSPITDAENILLGMVLRCEDEFMLVTTAGDKTNGNVVVTRAYNGSTAAAHTAASAPVYVATRTTQEDWTLQNDPYTTPDMQFNYCQQFVETYSVTDAESGQSRYFEKDAAGDIERKFAIRRAKATEEMFRLMELTLIHSRAKQAFSATAYGQMAGIYPYIYAGLIQNKAAAALSKAMVESVLETQADKVGQGNTSNLIVCNGNTWNKLTTLFTANTVITTNREASAKTGGISMNYIETNFGVLEVVYSNWMRNGEMFLLNPDFGGVGYLAGNEMREEPLAKTRTSEQRALKAIITFYLRNPYAHGYLYNFT